MAAAVCAVLTACTAEGGKGAARPDGKQVVVVASFDFPESELVAEIYAGALEAAGIPVRRDFGLGPRELVQPALLGGLVDVVPEYLGTALASLSPEPGVDMRDPVAVRLRLAEVLARWDVRVLDASPGQNQNGFAVTREVAQRLGLRSVSDLAGVEEVVVGGPPECRERLQCLRGLEDVYQLEVDDFVPFDTEGQRVLALREQVVNVAVMFTTDGQLAGGDLVLLDDDRRLQPAEHLVPLVSGQAADRYGPRLVAALGSVSALLTTESLTFLNWRVSVAGHGPGAEARAWLVRHGLVDRD